MKQTPVNVNFADGTWLVLKNKFVVGGAGATLPASVESFRDFANSLDARAVFEITGPDKVEAHRLLTS